MKKIIFLINRSKCLRLFSHQRHRGTIFRASLRLRFGQVHLASWFGCWHEVTVVSTLFQSLISSYSFKPMIYVGSSTTPQKRNHMLIECAPSSTVKPKYFHTCNLKDTRGFSSFYSSSPLPLAISALSTQSTRQPTTFFPFIFKTKKKINLQLAGCTLDLGFQRWFMLLPSSNTHTHGHCAVSGVYTQAIFFEMLCNYTTNC